MPNSKTSISSKCLLTQIATNVRQRVHAKRHERYGKYHGRGQSEDEEPKLRRYHEKVHVRERTHERDELVCPGRHGRRLVRNRR